MLIARGLLKKDAKIFLFDEATSNLDAHTEQAITKELETLLKGKTVIYCAHRLSSIINVDTIHVVSKGKLCEQGTHSTLMSNPDSLYKAMWQDYMKDNSSDSADE
jgi:ABC-type transport system involved in Fe-S cluster assembly fused permease/ATPase subunit